MHGNSQREVLERPRPRRDQNPRSAPSSLLWTNIKVKPLTDMEKALGSASVLVTVPISPTDNATIARWKHGDAEARITSGDGLIKIIVNLSDTQKVERLRHGAWTSKPVDICSFAIIPPDEDICFSVKG